MDPQRTGAALIFVYLTLLIISPQDWLGPFVGVPVDYIIYPIWLAAIVVSGRARNLLRTGWQDALVLAFLLWLTISAFVNASGGFDTHRLVMYAKWAVLYKLVSASLPTLAHVKRTGMVLVLLALVLSAESIQHFHDPNQTGWAGQTLGWISQDAMEAGVPGRTRWVSIFDGPGVFCVVFTVALPFLLQFVSRPFRAGTRISAGLLLVPLVVAIYYTGSRGGFLTALAIVGMHFGIRTRISMSKLVAVGVVLAVLFAAAPAYMTNIRDQERSAQHRVDVWMVGLWMVKDNPVLGVGRGNYATHTGSLIAHNSAIELAAETGLPGLFFWVAMIYIGFKQLWLYRRSAATEANRAYAAALGISLAGYVVSAMFVTLEYETLYFILGMTAAVGLQLERPARFGAADAAIVGTAAGVFLVGLKLFTSLYY